ncbi:SGNH/GDSL hydrolase family protein [Streptomyces sp. WMMC500]|uniref:SGNH/GDSL hydrolase family protein n=1 Tax=Streptomyces sp. WMMC500 TaxID=3015154 RepID=UPI00248CDE4E|nr:SGNH/GDSL hydrolase family protein [Streptomyces sp. WMMC500]WBB57791.1 SGNH/GDSL hydrolase family protein [Streptomyces sp. WMMC500]
MSEGATPSADPSVDPAGARGSGRRGPSRRTLGRAAVAAAATPALAGTWQTLTASAASAAEAVSARSRGWTGTWAAAETTVPAVDTTAFADQTLRQVVHTSAGGRALRIRLTNQYGTEPLVVGEVRVALSVPGDSTAVLPGTDRAVRFGGRTPVTLAPGTRRWSDPVSLEVPTAADLAVSVYLPRPTPGGTVHRSAFQRNHVAAGNVAAKPAVDPERTVTSWYFLAGVAVTGAAPGADAGAGTGSRQAIVTFGDSITDGSATTVGANRRWPDVLARRLRDEAGRTGTGVLNAGIGGNRLLRDPNPPPGSNAENYAPYFGEAGIRRFARDVLDQPAARHVVVLLGINDLGHPGRDAPRDEEVTAAELITGHRSLIRQAHARGLRIHGATILPVEGDDLGFYTPEREEVRQALNEWIRTGGEYDGTVDFDAATRDPAHPGRLLAAYDSGDGLHPNDAGMAAMAEAIPLRLFT